MDSKDLTKNDESRARNTSYQYQEFRMKSKKSVAYRDIQ